MRRFCSQSNKSSQSVITDMARGSGPLHGCKGTLQALNGESSAERRWPTELGLGVQPFQALIAVGLHFLHARFEVFVGLCGQQLVGNNKVAFDHLVDGA
jgi:hypothetical protein